MSTKHKMSARMDSGLAEVKSKFEAEFRRFSLTRSGRLSFEDFYQMIEKLHHLRNIPFLVTYTDKEGDLLPINNDDNFAKALATAKPVLRLCIQRKGQNVWEVNGYGTAQRKKNPIISKLIAESKVPRPGIQIGAPEDFRRVSAIIDVDIVPESHRRVKLMKNGSDKPLGFYIRDGTSVRLHANGVEKVPGIFISRLVPGGLAESTGLLAVNDEVLEVNGIEVVGKTLDQVTDMMVANSSNLIITVKPVNQRNNIVPRRGGSGRQSQKSTASLQSTQSGHSLDSDEIREYDEHDEVKDYTQNVTSSASHDGANHSVRSKDSAKASSAGSVGEGSGKGSSIAGDTSKDSLQDGGGERNSPMVTL